MSQGQRVFTYIAAGIAVVVIGWTALIAGIFLIGGVATVSVAERSEGLDFSVPIPMALVTVAAAATDVLLTDEIIDEIDVEVRGHLSEVAPLILEAVDALDDVPDGTTLVSVNDGDEHVEITKSGGKLRIRVESPDLSLKIAVPTRAVKQIIAQIVHD